MFSRQSHSIQDTRCHFLSVYHDAVGRSMVQDKQEGAIKLCRRFSVAGDDETKTAMTKKCYRIQQFSVELEICESAVHHFLSV